MVEPDGRALTYRDLRQSLGDCESFAQVFSISPWAFVRTARTQCCTADLLYACPDAIARRSEALSSDIELHGFTESGDPFPYPVLDRGYQSII